MWRWPAPSEERERRPTRWRSSGGTSGTIWTGRTDKPGQLTRSFSSSSDVKSELKMSKPTCVLSALEDNYTI